MISQQEQERIRLISDNELYPQAVEFISKLSNALPSTQINGLLNVALGNTYYQLHHFIKKQRERRWQNKEEYIRDFYNKLAAKLTNIETTCLPCITQSRTEKISPEDRQAICMALAREFIQHVLAENGYRAARHDFQSQQPAEHNIRKPEQWNRERGAQHR